MLYVETSALEATNVENAFLTVLTEIYRIMSKKTLLANDGQTMPSRHLSRELGLLFLAKTQIQEGQRSHATIIYLSLRRRPPSSFTFPYQPRLATPLPHPHPLLSMHDTHSLVIFSLVHPTPPCNPFSPPPITFEP
ncbi:hypothetical protein ACSBR1_022716 [Camellia fascicularis]